MGNVRQALRQFVLRPGLAAAVITMLAVGIGATTAIFSLFYQVLLQPLPVPEPDRLVQLRVEGSPALGIGRMSLAVGDPESALSYSVFRDLEQQQTSFTGIGGHYDFLASITTGTDSYGGNGVVVSGRYFEVLGVTPALGRLIGPQDEPGLHESPVVVLSYDYWQSRLGADPTVVGRVLTVNDQALTVVGVAPDGFTGAMPGWRPAVFVPMTMRWAMQPDEPRGNELHPLNRFLYAFARLRPGVAMEQATAEIDGLYGGIVAERVLPAATFFNEAQPGVTAVGQSAIPLLANFAFNGGVDTVGALDLPNDNTAMVQRHPWISPGFFAALGLPLLAGREFTATDVAAGGEVAIVNQAFLRRFNLGPDVIGSRMQMTMGYGADSVEIVGIAGDAKYGNVKNDTVAQIYTPRPPRDDAFAAVFFYVRGTGDAAALLRVIPGAVADVAPTLPVNGLETLEHRVSDNVSQDRLMASLSAVFAALATMLAAVGVYAVLSYNIGGRTREIGLRLALGSSPGRLRLMVLKQVGTVAVIGAASGLAAALGVGAVASSLLFELSGYDPLVFGGALAVIAVVVLCASYLPARRASHLAPMEALRHE